MLKLVKFYLNEIPLLFICFFPLSSLEAMIFTFEKDCFAYSQIFSKI